MKNENKSNFKSPGGRNSDKNKFSHGGYGKNNKNDRFDKSDKGDRFGSVRNENANEEEIGLIYGRNPVLECLASGKVPDKLYVAEGDREGSIKLVVAKAIDLGVPIVSVDKRKLDSMCKGANHQGVAALASFKEYCSVEDILEIAKEKGEPPFIVIADGVEDPGNLGALIRCCDIAGVHGLIIPKRHGATVTSVTAKASAGALEHVAVAKVANLSYAIKTLKENGVWIYGAEAGGESLRRTDLRGAAAFVFGSEGAGISRLVSENCDFIVSIDMYGKVNSLNVSCAAAVVLSEAAYQRHNK